ncbi:putative RNA methyltransferase [Citrus sinensis]|uniref:RNA methyltransferase n=1 Tax=Citrus sinensis TaxID=2711 RepID=A0ACB8NRX1_CITSI|nr:putative RNA methyltransferase [Citrus sinensis]
MYRDGKNPHGDGYPRGFSPFGEVVADELDSYLDEKVIPRMEDFNILSWWKTNANRYPTLARIARDILAIPITTVASESVFNTSGRVIGQGLNEDPRFKVLKKEWFEGKDCLDIGCNSGIITIQIAQKFNCRSILGIDIDSNRVADAYWHLRKIVRTEHNEKRRANASRVEVIEKGDGLEKNVTAAQEEKKAISRNCSPAERNLFDIVSFKQENFVHGRDSPEKYYDAILCLSVTKWIHLNWGDDGLITLFMRIWKLLRPGGIFVLEPQPWVSYEKNRRVSETTATNFQNIKLYPKEFQEILLDKVSILFCSIGSAIGFRTVEDIGSGGLSSSKTGFNRPIFLFRK